MHAKTKFMKFYYKLPKKARSALVMRFATDPMTLNVVAFEVRYNTPTGEKLLKELGFKDE
jgi:hypothetical protein